MIRKTPRRDSARRCRCSSRGRRSRQVFTILLPVFGVVALLSAAATNAPEVGRVSGAVSAAATGAPLEDSTVLIVETKDIWKTGQNGLFEFRLAVGTYTCLITRSGYWKQIHAVEIVSGEGLNLIIRLERLPSQFGEGTSVGSGAACSSSEATWPSAIASSRTTGG